MPRQFLNIVLDLNEIAKKNQTGPIACHWCNNQDSIIKYGKYKRYDFTGEKLVDIQRYLCKHDQCRRTFSILPHPFLRICRITLCMLIFLLQSLNQKTPKSHIVKQFGVPRSTLYWVIDKGRDILDWIDKEVRANASWGPSPCVNPAAHWSNYIRMFAMKFYPKRYACGAPTEYVN